MLLSQKLNIKMKNITVSAIEDHEKVMEVYDNMLYLSEQLKLSGSYKLLSLVSDNTTANYSHLTKIKKFLWESQVTSESDVQSELLSSVMMLLLGKELPWRVLRKV